MPTTYYASDIGSDLDSGSGQELKLVEAADTLGEIITGTISGGTTTKPFSHFTEPGIPGTDGVTGDYTVEVDVNDGETAIDLSVQLHRVNASGTVQSSSGVSDPQNATAGVKTFSFTSVDLDTWVSGDRLRVDIFYTSLDSHGNTSTPLLGFNTEDSEVVTPWSESAAYEETLTTSITATTDLLDRFPVADRDQLLSDLAPIAWWQLGDSSGDDLAGTHDLTWNNAPTFNSTGSPIGGEDKGYVSLDDASTQWADIANQSDLARRDDMAFEVWVRSHATSGGQERVFSAYGATESDLWELRWDPANDFYAVAPTNVADGAGVGLPVGDPDDNNVWQHWVVNIRWTDNTRVIQVFHDGDPRYPALVTPAHAAGTGEFTYRPGTDTYDVDIGRQGGVGNYFDGDIAEISFYDRALRPSEARDLFSAFYPIQLTGTVTAVASVDDASLTLAHPLAGSLSAVASATASLTSVGTHELESSSSAVASVSASLDITRQLAGAVTSVASVSGQLDVKGTAGLVGSISAVSTLSATLAQSHSLVTSIQAIASSTAALLLSVRLLVSSSSVAALSATATQTHTPFVQVQATASLATSLTVRFVVSLYATGDGTIVDVVNEDDVGTGLFDSIDDDPALPEDADWINNAVGV